MQIQINVLEAVWLDLTPHPQKSVMTKSPKFSELDNPFFKKQNKNAATC